MNSFSNNDFIRHRAARKESFANVFFRLALIICAVLLLLPCQVSAARRVDRERKKRTAKKEVKQTRTPSIRAAKDVLAELTANVHCAQSLSTKQKAVLVEGLECLAQTERGKWILQHSRPNIRFKRLSDKRYSGFYDWEPKISMSPKILDNISNAKSPLNRQRALFRMISTLSHELTHSCWHNLGLSQKEGMSFVDYAIIRKLDEFHAILESRSVSDQILELPEFQLLAKSRPKSFLRKIAEQLQQNGTSRQTAERFARTEFIKAIWRNRPDTPVKIGENLLFFKESAFPNYFYNIDTFGEITDSGPHYFKKTGIPARRKLTNIIDTMQIDISPDFLYREKTFQYKQGRFICYMNGKINQEIDYLTIGIISKKFRINDHCLTKVDVIIRRPQDGSFKDYWYGIKHVRATYTVRNKQMEGVYKEYDPKGNQTAEIPFEKGKANGIGWIMQNGNKTEKSFRRNSCYNLNESSQRTK